MSREFEQYETDIREYNEGYTPLILPVREFAGDPESYRYMSNHPENNPDHLVIVAFNEGNHNSTAIDLHDVIRWVKANRPEMLED